jgi:hypothetical protein
MRDGTVVHLPAAGIRPRVGERRAISARVSERRRSARGVERGTVWSSSNADFDLKTPILLMFYPESRIKPANPGF